MTMKPRDVTTLVDQVLFPAFQAELECLDRIDRWYRWDHDQPHKPRQSTTEYKELSARAQTPWGNLIVTAVAQSMYVEGYRAANDPENAEPWKWWQANGLDGRQIAVNRAALAYGLSYGTVLPGQDMFGTPMPVMRGHSPRRMLAMYQDAAQDDWPMYAIGATPTKLDASTTGFVLKVYDDEAVYNLLADASGKITYVDFNVHNVGVCPVVRICNQLDLEGRTPGEVEPFIPVLGRIDQTVFDRLVVQRFTSWVVRTIAGMSKPDEMSQEDWDAAKQANKLRLMVEDILVAEDKDTKFGSLPASSLSGFIEAKDADLRDLSAIAQVPPHHLLGQMANLSAEALAAAEASLTRKVQEREHAFGESYEQWLRLAAHVMGDANGAQDIEAQVRWRDTESRSLAQAADALGKMAESLGIPVEMLWERLPGWTDQDTARAKLLVAQPDGVDALLRTLLEGQQTAPAAPTV